MKRAKPRHRVLVLATLLLGGAWAGSARAAAPVLDPIANMSVCLGGTADQSISATDPDGDAMTFTSSGPAFLTVTSNAQLGTTRTGSIHVAPGPSDGGVYQASVTVTANGQFDDQTFSITVTSASIPPVLNQPANMTVEAGSTADQTITGSDACGFGLTFSKVSGPTYATVLNVTVNPPTGRIHLAPGLSDVGTAAMTIRASNGSAGTDKSFTVTVLASQRPPTLNPIPNVVMQENCVLDQPVSGSDPNGDPLTFSKVAGPTFMTVTTTSPTTGNIHLATGFSDAGAFGATVSASDGFASDSKSFTIQVVSVDRAPVLQQPANMTVNEGATADQVLAASDPDVCDTGGITFSKVAGPTFMTVTTTNATRGNVHLAPSFSDGGTYAATVSASDGILSDQKSFTITVNTSDPAPVLSQPANMTVNEGATADQGISATSASGSLITLSIVTGPAFMTLTQNAQVGGARTGNLHLAPAFTDAGTYTATIRVIDDGGLQDQKSFTITVHDVNLPPNLAQPANMTVNEGATANQTVVASDPDGNAVTFSKASGPLFMTVTTISGGTGTATGSIHLAPSFADEGTYTAMIRVTDGSLADQKSFAITVVHQDRCPIANPGGPYTFAVGTPITFNGTGSSDPDGDVLTYVWDFGDGTTGTGPTPVHVYTVAGSFQISLTVTDPTPCSDTASTVAVVVQFCATVFNGYDVIRLATGRPHWFALVQPSNGCYANTDVVLSSFVLKYSGRQIPADATKTTLDSDRNGDGIQEIRVSFSKANLRTLFAGLPSGHTTVEVTLEANLATGGLLQGTTTVDVVSNGSFTAAEVSPNPFNPEAVITFTTTRTGPVNVTLFDVGGRLVRTLLDEPSLAAGVHEVRIDGRGRRGEPLSSGIYFIRGISTEGAFKRSVVMLK